MESSNIHWDLAQREIIDAEIRRVTRKRMNKLGAVDISTTGTKVPHGLGIIPNWVDIKAIEHNGAASESYWYYQQPDSQYLYVKSKTAGRFIITVGE